MPPILFTYLITGILGAVAVFGVLKAIQYSGVQKERVRVEKIETKKNAAAHKAVAAARRDPKRVLERHYRD